MSVVSFKRRLGRLDHGKSSEARAIEKLTDEELEAQIKVRLAEIDPALVAQWEAASERSETDEDFSFLDATREIWRQADVILGGRA
jgi:hypothetical protein